MARAAILLCCLWLAAVRAGADAVLAASIFHDGETTCDDVKRALAAAGVVLRA